MEDKYEAWYALWLIVLGILLGVILSMVHKYFAADEECKREGVVTVCRDVYTEVTNDWHFKYMSPGTW